MLAINITLLLVIAYVFYRHRAQEKRIASLVRVLGHSRACCEHIAATTNDEHFRQYHFGEARAYECAEMLAWKHLNDTRKAPPSSWSKYMARRVWPKTNRDV